MTHRLFIAIDLPPDQRSLVSGTLETLAKSSLPVNWEPRQKLHITLNFIGRLDDSTQTALRSRLQAITSRTAPFSLQFYFLEGLYRRHSGSLVYLTPAGDIPALLSLQKSLVSLLADMAIPQPLRFTPHLLLGRLIKSDPVSAKKTLARISDLDFTPLPPFTVSAVTLYESFLTKAGAYHQKTGQFMLKSTST